MLNIQGGENGGRVPSTPYGFVYGRPLTCVMHCPIGVGLSGLFRLLARHGASICSGLLMELEPWSENSSVMRASNCTSKPFTRYVGPLMSNVVLPRCTGSNSGNWMLLHFM